MDEAKRLVRKRASYTLGGGRRTGPPHPLADKNRTGGWEDLSPDMQSLSPERSNPSKNLVRLSKHSCIVHQIAEVNWRHVVSLLY